MQVGGDRLAPRCRFSRQSAHRRGEAISHSLPEIEDADSISFDAQSKGLQSTVDEGEDGSHRSLPTDFGVSVNFDGLDEDEREVSYSRRFIIDLEANARHRRAGRV